MTVFNGVVSLNQNRIYCYSEVDNNLRGKSQEFVCLSHKIGVFVL